MHRRRGDGGKESVFMCEWRREFGDADEGRVSRTGSGGVTSAGQVAGRSFHAQKVRVEFTAA